MGLAMSGFSENVKFVEDVHNGVTTTLSFEGDALIVNKQWDAEPYLKAAAEERSATAGERWGEGRKVFHLPEAEYGRYLKETRGWSRQDKSAWLKRWALEHPLLISFDKYIK